MLRPPIPDRQPRRIDARNLLSQRVFRDPFKLALAPILFDAREMRQPNSGQRQLFVGRIVNSKLSLI
jgi:hypothetical protein